MNCGEAAVMSRIAACLVAGFDVDEMSPPPVYRILPGANCAAEPLRMPENPRLVHVCALTSRSRASPVRGAITTTLPLGSTKVSGYSGSWTCEVFTAESSVQVFV